MLYFLLFFISPLMAEDKPPQVIVIKAKRPLTSPILTPSYTMFSASQLTALQQTRVKDILQQEPGVSVVQSGSIGQPTSVFVRGMNAEHVQVRIDGMKATPPESPNGSYDFSDFTTDGLQSIEMIRGAAGSLYGVDAVSGVISITSLKGGELLQTTVLTEIGTTPSERGKISVSGEIDKVNLALTTSVFHTSGTATKPAYLQQGSFARLPYTLKNYTLRAGKKVSELTEIIIFSRYAESSLFYHEIARIVPQSRSQSLNRIEINHSVSNNWSHQIGIGALTSTTENAKNFDSYTKGNGDRLAFNWIQKMTPFHGHLFQTVVEGERESFKNNSKESSLKAHGETLGMGGLYRWTPLSTLTLEASLRKDLNNRFTSPSCYRLGASYKLSQLKTEIFSSTATAFKSPSLYSLYGKGAYFKPNPALNPEKVRSYEIGIKQPIGESLKGTVIWFHNKLSQLIIYDPISQQMQNLANAETKGLESILSLTLSHRIKIEANHTWLLTQNKKTGEMLRRRPRHKVFLRVGYSQEKLNIFLEGIYMGKRRDLSAVDYKATFNKPYKTVALKMTYQWNESLSSFIRIENLLNKKIEEPLGYQQPGMTGYVGLQARF